jgi:hypothetical protein
LCDFLCTKTHFPQHFCSHSACNILKAATYKANNVTINYRLPEFEIATLHQQTHSCGLIRHAKEQQQLCTSLINMDTWRGKSADNWTNSSLNTRQAMFVLCSIKAPSCNNCCCGRAINITYYVCVCGIGYPAWNAHTLYCHLWPFHLYNIFTHYLINVIFLGGGGELLKIKCVPCFSLQLISENFLILRRSEIR